MAWGGYYAGMRHYGVGVIHIKSLPVAKFYGVPGLNVTPLTIQFYDASTEVHHPGIGILVMGSAQQTKIHLTNIIIQGPI